MPLDADSDKGKEKVPVTMLAVESLVLVTSAIAAEIRNDAEGKAQGPGENLQDAHTPQVHPKVEKSRVMNRIQWKWRDPATNSTELYCIQILHLEDSPFDAALILDQLESGDLPCAITHAMNRVEYETAVKQRRFDVILCDHNVPGYSGFAALEFAKQYQPEVPVIILSGALDDEQAVQSLKHGATDYILKERLARLVPAIRRALDEADDQIIKAAAENRIREQASLLNLMRDAILVRSMDDQIVYWNPGAEVLFGWSAEEAMGQNFAGLLQGNPVQLESARKSLLRSGDWVGEIHLKGKTGEDRTVLSRWNLVRGKDGKPHSIVSSNTDMTSLKSV
jgi:PAS domain S-box-containing protein